MKPLSPTQSPHCSCPGDPAHIVCEACDEWRTAVNLGRQLERAAIVAWLRSDSEARAVRGDRYGWWANRDAALMLERADHLRPDIKDGEGESK